MRPVTHRVLTRRRQAVNIENRLPRRTPDRDTLLCSSYGLSIILGSVVQSPPVLRHLSMPECGASSIQCGDRRRQLVSRSPWLGINTASEEFS